VKNPQYSLILASTSRYRAELLARLGLAFVSQSPGVDETPEPNEGPAALTQRLARLKAEAVSRQHPDAVVIGSDQTAAWQTQCLGKPGTAERAVEQLRLLSGQRVTFHTAWTVQRGAQQRHGSDLTHVQFRALSTTDIRHYVERESPLDCAGSFKSEGLGVCLFESIQSEDPTALIGLPLIAIANALRAFGIDPLA